jgi:hypothetical protein
MYFFQKNEISFANIHQLDEAYLNRRQSLEQKRRA